MAYEFECPHCGNEIKAVFRPVEKLTDDILEQEYNNAWEKHETSENYREQYYKNRGILKKFERRIFLSYTEWLKDN